ncbi:MAG: transglycosylase domain-containing protein [Candidatus Parcubacteria bacterium]|nr:transglycosylase domain-containing protein [Candidatus Parcubacteria bacterium]
MRKKRKLRIFWFFLGICVFLGIIGSGIILFWAANLKVPDSQSFNERKTVQSTKIYDRTGKILLWDIHQNIQRTVVPFDEISRNLKNATVAIEDSSFYHHHGIVFSSLVRAFFVDLITGKFEQGGSTISQQLVKNTLLTREKSFTRKIKEIILTLKMEKVLSKEEILNLYLNEISYGGTVYGAEAASESFLGKKAENLDLAESAYLAALPQAPTYYSPYGDHRQELEDRKNFVLKRMTELGFITPEEETSAKKEKVNFLGGGNNSLKAPHFSIFIRSYLENKYGRDAVEEDGLKITTTLDYGLQQKAEQLVAQYAKENKEKFNASNAGLVAIDPRTGQILVMVGSKDYFNVKDQGNFNITIAHRQPGSSIKPFVYATAFKKGFTPDTIVYDLKTEFTAACNADGTPGPNAKPEDCYSPDDYDGLFRGPITLRNSLAQSVNISSVKVLYLAGLEDSIQTATDMGITSLNDPNRFGLSLVLGGGEVSPLELTGAYSVFANNGERNPIAGILKIEDKDGNVLEEFSPHPQEVLDRNIALLVTDVLTDNVARTPAFGASSPLYFPGRQVAAKTGTTNNYRDAWVMGYTPSMAVGVWVGNNDNTSMAKKVAGFIAAPLWNAFFSEALKNLPVEEFEKPIPQPEPKPILAGDWRTGSIHDTLYWLNKDDPLGPQPTDPASDPQFNHWEYAVQKWAKEQGF